MFIKKDLYVMNDTMYDDEYTKILFLDYFKNKPIEGVELVKR